MEKKHNSSLSIIFLNFLDYLVRIKADNFLIEITLKLDFFGYIRDILDCIYINETLV